MTVEAVTDLVTAQSGYLLTDCHSF